MFELFKFLIFNEFNLMHLLSSILHNTTNPEEISKIDQAIGNIKFALGRVYGSKTRKSKAPVIQPKSSRKR